ncbi:MAG: hypothetical protein GF331_08725 [Chitinivibrionales bacterium]|nr:hypothetical protein [Chitinivibrionales bacterium]
MSNGVGPSYLCEKQHHLHSTPQKRVYGADSRPEIDSIDDPSRLLMKHILLLSLLLLIACAVTHQVTEQDEDMRQLRRTLDSLESEIAEVAQEDMCYSLALETSRDSIDISVFYVDSSCDGDTILRSLTTDEELYRIDRVLGTCASVPPGEPMLIAQYRSEHVCNSLRSSQYFRQYLISVEDGDTLVMISGFHVALKKVYADWKDRYLRFVGYGGGAMIWHATVNLTEMQLQEFYMNAPE